MAIFLTPPSTAANVQSGTTTQEGTVRLATIAEAGTNSETLAVTPAGLQAELAGIVDGGVTYRGTVAVVDIATDLASASVGDLYKVSTSGTAHGYTWSIGDTIIVNTDMGGTFDAAKINRLDTTDSDLATVATTGSYSDLSGKPAIPSASTDLTDSADLVRNTDIASTTSAGIVEIADNTETSAGTSTTLAVSPAGLANELTSYATTASLAAVATSGAYGDLSGTPTTSDDFTANHTGVNYTGLTTDTITTHLSAIDSELGTLSGAITPTLDDVVTNGNTTTLAINVGEITASGDILPDADATRSIGDENTRFVSYYGDMNGAIRFKAKNNQGGPINKGQAVYISGFSGTVPEVKLAQANSASTMPAFGLAFATANHSADIEIVTFGNLNAYNTTTYSLSANDTVYVSATTAGALTNSAPTGESNLIQNIGRVVRADASAGIIKVGGAGRSNATPNLNDGKIFLGNASNQAVSTALSSINLTSFNDDLTYPVTSVNTLTGAVTVSGDDILADHSATYYTAVNNNVDGHLSGIDSKFGTLGTASTAATTDFLQVSNNLSEVTPTTARSNLGLGTAATSDSTDFLASTADLNDLNDVVISNVQASQLLQYDSGTGNWVNATVSTGGASNLNGLSDVTITSAAQGEVLRYNGSAWVDAQLDYSDLSGTPTNVSAFSNDEGYLTDITGELINSLSNVSISGLATNDILKYDGSNWVNTKPQIFLDYFTASSNTSMFRNRGYLVTANSITLTLPAISTLQEGDTFAVTSSSSYSVTIAINGADSGNILYNVGSGTSSTSHTITVNKQEILIRYNGTIFYIVSSNKIAELSEDTSPSLGGTLNVEDYAIASTSNRDITLSPNGTGAVNLSNTANAPELRFYETSTTNYVALKAPATIASNVTLTLPNTDGNANQVLQTDGSGALSWVNQASGGGGYTYSAIIQNTPAQTSYHYSCTNAITVTLPLSSGTTAGEEIRIKNMDASNTITITPNALDSIDGLSAGTSYSLSVAYSAITLVSNGSNGWEII